MVASAPKNASAKKLNIYIQEKRNPFALDRKYIYNYFKKTPKIGEKRRVGIIDNGLPLEDDFVRCSLLSDGSAKLVIEVDARSLGAPRERRTTKIPVEGCPSQRDMGGLIETLPLFSSHLTKSLVFGYYPSPPILGGREQSGLAVASEVGIVSIVFRTRLYVHDTKHRIVSRVDLAQAIDYLGALARSVTWLVRNFIRYNISSVQLSAVDGIGVAPDWYRQRFPNEYQSWTLDLLTLRRFGLWISAASGNQHVTNTSAGYNWPASDPNIISVGCYNNITMEPTRQRGLGLDIMSRTLDVDPFTSYCNTVAVATSILIRDVCENRCGIINLTHCSAEFVLFIMQKTAEIVRDPDAPDIRLYILHPSRLYPFLFHDQSFCTVLDNFAHDKEASLATLPWRSSYFGGKGSVANPSPPIIEPTMN
uniref:subtilisin n=1 Tax=Aureoumbra lagunensis TaxID=44058 RepID=A0A7S3JSY1_9STRA